MTAFLNRKGAANLPFLEDSVTYNCCYNSLLKNKTLQFKGWFSAATLKEKLLSAQENEKLFRHKTDIQNKLISTLRTQRTRPLHGQTKTEEPSTN